MERKGVFAHSVSRVTKLFSNYSLKIKFLPRLLLFFLVDWPSFASDFCLVTPAFGHCIY